MWAIGVTVYIDRLGSSNSSQSLPNGYHWTMARTQTIVQLSDDLLTLLDVAASKRGMSRSALVREAVEHHLHEEREAELVARMVDGYRRRPQGEPDDWGDLGRLGEETSAAVMRRLDVEERSDGHEPW